MVFFDCLHLSYHFLQALIYSRTNKVGVYPSKSESISHQQLHMYAHALRRRGFFPASSSLEGKVIYHFWAGGSGSLDITRPVSWGSFGGHQGKHVPIYSSEVGLYMMVVRNCMLLVLLNGRSNVENKRTFRLYLVVPLVANTPFLILLVARWLRTV